jgi:squalene-hopene/tetraprenyl-beta-curcumene cyclase
MIDPDRLLAAYRTARDDLLAERGPAGHWVGELSSSALSTATATSALSLVAGSTAADPSLVASARPLIPRGLEYLVSTQNADGGWGDTDRSLSNIATTMLARAAFHLAGAADRHRELLARASEYIDSQGGVDGLRRRYGKDKTFAVPILTNCALAGLADWKRVAPLPFELACLPYPVLRFLRLPVVSYAVPALVAVGQAGYCHRKPRNPITRLVRRLTKGRSLNVLERMQPDSGGFLEATPLTSFVVMCLAGIGHAGHPVVRRGVEFLVRSVREDGSWPIDTDLAAWVTTLSLNALDGSGEDVAGLGCLPWLLECQHRRLHPFTNADPGGWGWSDLSGAVPDADDTAGALLALAAIRRAQGGSDAGPIDAAAAAGIGWLLNLQNADGGWPTFCRGWGALPFDRSGVDLTAHVIRALAAWKDAPIWGLSQFSRSENGTVPFGLASHPHPQPLSRKRARGVAKQPLSRMETAIRRGLAHLAKRQRPDGSWVPLWFGNQLHPEEENPVYGTARTLLAYRDLGHVETEPARRGLAWLVAAENEAGGWGGSGEVSPGGRVSSVEETALAVETLLSAGESAGCEEAARRGIGWLVEAVEAGEHRKASPIGFYFAKLWYYERLYPIIFTVGALGTAARRLTAGPYRTTARLSSPETAP